MFDNDHDPTKKKGAKGGSCLIDIHLTRLLAVYSKHYITAVVADG